MSSLTTTTNFATGTTTTTTTNAATATTTMNIFEIYTQTLEILNTNPFHFITLSLLFLPLIISTVATTLFFTTTTTLLISTFFTILPTVIATALITYSTSHTINNTPLTFKSTLNSLPHSFLPLLSTFLAAALQLTIIYLFFTFIIPVVIKLTMSSSFHDPTICTNTLFSFVSKLTILYFVSVWGSSASISVLELKSGFDSLRESQRRAKNTSFSFRFSSFVAVLVTGIMIGSVMYFCVVVVRDVKLETKWHLYVQACAYLLALCLVLLQYVVLNTVLYFECNVEAKESPKMDSVTTSSGYGFSFSFLFLAMIGFVRVSIGLFVNRH